MAEANRDSRGYTIDEVSVGGIGMGALLIAGAIVLAIVAAFVAIHAGYGRHTPPLGAEHRKPPDIEGAVTLQPAPQQDIAVFRSEKARALEGYAWADPDHRYARIPIERAMALLATQHAAAQGQH